MDFLLSNKWILSLVCTDEHTIFDLYFSANKKFISR